MKSPSGKVPEIPPDSLRQLAFRDAPDSPNRHPVLEQVLQAARKQLDRFASLESKVLKGDDREAIHDIRVASRRLQQVMDVIYPPPAPARIRKLRRSIRRCRRALSEVRNCDVLLERTERTLRRKRVRRREAWEAFQDYLKPRRARLFRKTSRRLSKLNLSTTYLDFRKELAALRNPAAWSAWLAAAGQVPPLAVDIDSVLRQRMAASLEKTWGGLLVAVTEARENRAAGSLHAVRIAGKKARYLIEVIHLLREPGSDAPLKYLRRMQGLLGDWHDLEVLEQTMLEMVARSGMLSAQLELAIDVERVVISSRKRKLACETAFYQTSRETGDWGQIDNWVKSFVASNQAPEVRKNAQSLRLLAEPHRLRPGNLSR